MIRLTVAALLTFAPLAAAQTDPKDVDIGSMLKKPCDDDKKKPEATPTPAPTPKAEAKVEALPGLIPADKQPAAPANKGLGALGAMENCK